MRASGSSLVSYQKRSVPRTRHIGSSRRSPFMSPAMPDVVGRSAVQEDDAVGPLDERARRHRGEEAVHGRGLVGRRPSSSRKRRSASRRGTGAGAVGAALALSARHSTRAISPWLRAKTAPSAKPGGDHTKSRNSVEPGALRPSLGARLADVQGPLLGQDDEVVAHQQREAVARLARAPAQARRSRRRRR